MKIIFFGSSDFSIPALKACCDASHDIVLVITTPDQKKGRGLKYGATVVKTFCEEYGLPVNAPESLKNPALIDAVQALSPDLFVVSSYGKFIPSSWLKIPSVASLNVHPSLLPKYRGASPLNAPILNGDKETGISIAEVTAKLDAGDVFAQTRFPLDDHMDALQLEEKLGDLSYGLLLEVMQQAEKGKLHRVPQDEAAASYAGKLHKEDGLVHFGMDALEISRRVRGLKPWPGAYLLIEGLPFILLDVEAQSRSHESKPGTLLEIHTEGVITMATGKGVLHIKKVKPAGKKEMTGADYIRGRRLQPGFVFPS